MRIYGSGGDTRPSLSRKNFFSFEGGMREMAVRSVAKLRVVGPCSFKVAAEGSILRNVQGIGCNLPPEKLCCW